MGDWGGGEVSKKPPENVMELRESRLSYHLKPTQTMLKRKGFFTAIHLNNQPSNSSVDITWGRRGMGGFNPPYQGCFLLESNFVFKSKPLL